MYRGTTPTICWNISDNLEFEDIDQVWMTFKDENGEKLTKSAEQLTFDEENKTITYDFTQEETLKFAVGNIETQLRILTTDGQAFATSIQTFHIDKILKGGVIK